MTFGHNTTSGVLFCILTGVHTHRGRLYCPRNTLEGGSLRQSDKTLVERPHAPAVPILRSNTGEKDLGVKIIDKDLTHVSCDCVGK